MRSAYYKNGNRRCYCSIPAAAAAMSPLTRSLVAFAALLAAADANSVFANADSNPFCNSVATGNQRSDGAPWQRPNFVFEVSRPSGTVDIPDKCSQSGKTLVAQSIYACSRAGPPSISVGGQQFSPITVMCPDTAGGCSFNVSQFCDD
ncbi:uncharacterized protein LOC133533796 [Cydia pomonella]|uniref:uncharacterized protein LOC133533796 n=1 Tax=Cydia pomonella TaxID=82600 RepID=UPI002ADD7888|nr:uncharacterized protein LOC133533796 [Cydia pomonella]